MQDLGTVLKEFMKRYPAMTEGATAQTLKRIQADPDIQQFWTEHQSELKQDALVVSMMDLFEFMREKSREQDPKKALYPGYRPTLVVEKGYPHVSYEPTKQLVKQMKQKQLLTAFAVPKSALKADLSEVVQDFVQDSGRAKAMNVVADTLSHLIEKKQTKSDRFIPGVYLSGDFGVGKTFLMGAFANSLANNEIPVMMVHWASVIEDLKATFKKKNDESLKTMVNQMKQVSVLIIDDIGADTLTSWSRDAILGVILEYRMQHELTTCFTSNFEMDGLQDYLAQTKDGVEQGKAARLMQRVRFLSEPLQMSGENRRLMR
ncbi:primosomal protein DnaI [Fructobacillus sp. M2-14]|uniref:Primosomal protein DnaI n=1 Tax=Fructobacillus broussonetiae TaxID=2713173 RepID=A0ABS5R009_9LACO|nr:primosomal protein DnaI [Fructobacillus broussonetiae]MBS9338788.1 primosomal protein DnaI [Fructobacillus broussonetiae]